MNSVTKYSTSLLMATSFMVGGHKTSAQNDTVKVMAYNVLDYGFDCQGPVAGYHQYLKTIIDYTQPDILTLEKMASIPMYAGDISGKAPVGFGDSILAHVLNVVVSNKFAYAPFSNNAGASNMSMLFYNSQRFGFAGIVFNYSNITDFNCYKLFYKDANLSLTHDTTFLYIIPNHDISGSTNVSQRAEQITGYMSLIQQHFSHLPNMISMGDFNLRYTIEPLYQTLTALPDSNFRFYDPPFFPDNKFSYPANWDINPAAYSGYLTTSTRALATAPNSCGTSDGGKNWYDHIFISPWLVNNSDYIHYVPNSYRTIGNDGHRVGISANDNTSNVNNSAPTEVIEAIYQMSNKYPIMMDLIITPDSNGISPASPELHSITDINNTTIKDKKISIVNPVNDQLSIYISNDFIGRKMQLHCFDNFGRMILSKEITMTGNNVKIPLNTLPGIYFISIAMDNSVVYKSVLIKD